MFDIKEPNRPVFISAANYIIIRVEALNMWRCENGMSRIRLTSKKLQKLLYLCTLFWLEENDNCKMIPEEFKTWPNGPVIPELYDYFSVYSEGDLCPCINPDDYVLTEEEKDLIHRVVDNAYDINTETLIDYTIMSGTPWTQFNDSNNIGHGTITQDSMKKWIRNSNNQDNLIQFLTNKGSNTQEEGNILKKVLHKTNQKN